jgi:hypothetical protein
LVPHLDSYQLIQNTKVPPHEEIFRHISFEPETQMTNLPLSIFNLIHFGDAIGATDQILLTMLTIYLKKYKPTVLDTLDTKKQSLNAVIETLAFHCTTDMERSTVLQKDQKVRPSQAVLQDLNLCIYSICNWTNLPRRTKFGFLVIRQ